MVACCICGAILWGCPFDGVGEFIPSAHASYPNPNIRHPSRKTNCYERTHCCGLVPRPLISRDFILTEMVSLIQIEIMKKSEVKGPEDITPPKIKITSRELSFWGVFVYIYLSQCRVFLKKIPAYLQSLQP